MRFYDARHQFCHQSAQAEGNILYIGLSIGPGCRRGRFSNSVTTATLKRYLPFLGNARTQTFVNK